MRIRFVDKMVNSIMRDKKKLALVVGVAVAAAGVIVWFDKKFKPAEEKATSIDSLAETEEEA